MLFSKGRKEKAQQIQLRLLKACKLIKEMENKQERERERERERELWRERDGEGEELKKKDWRQKA
jgi:hypothetical protein